MMALIVILPVLAGVKLAQAFFQTGSRLSWIVLGVALQLCLAAFFCSVAFQFLPLRACVFAYLTANAGALFILRRRSYPASVEWSQTRPGLGMLAILCLLVFIYCNSWQLNHPDYDFWLDYAQQGLLTRGDFPPHNPFFYDLPLEGHYGRNLLIAALSITTSADLVAVQHWFTNLTQVLSVLVLYCALRFWDRSECESLLAALFATLGVATGKWVGLLDHFFHHASLAQLCLFTAFAVLGALTRKPSKTRIFIAAGVLSSLACVFEIYLGLLVLTILAFSLLRRRPLLKSWLSAAPLAIALALLAPGPLRSVLTPTSSPIASSLGSQVQQFSLTFPKADFLQIKLQPWSYWRRSSAYQSNPYLARWAGIDAPAGYRSIFSLEVVRLHWLPLYLCPLTLIWCIRSRNRAGTFWWTFGFFAYLVPGLVDFGPVYEAEYYRWEYAASLSFSIVLALASVDVARRVNAFYIGERADYYKGLLGVPLLLVFGYIVCIAGTNRLLGLLWTLDATRINTWFFPTVEGAWLTSHQDELGITSADQAASQWLRLNSQPGQRVLSSPSRTDVGIRAMRPDSILAGLSGLRCVGHSFPTALDPISTPPFRPSAQSRIFWSTGDPFALSLIPTDWLYQRLPSPYPPLATGTARWAKTFQTGDRRVVLYRASAYTAQLTSHASKIELVGPFPEIVAAGSTNPWPLRVLPPLAKAALKCRISFGSEVCEQEVILKESSENIIVWIPAPYEVGKATLSLSLLDAEDSVVFASNTDISVMP